MIISRAVLVDFTEASQSPKDSSVFFLDKVEKVIDAYLNDGFELRQVVSGEIDFATFGRKAVQSPILLIFTKDDGKSNLQVTSSNNPNRIQKS